MSKTFTPRSSILAMSLLAAAGFAAAADETSNGQDGRASIAQGRSARGCRYGNQAGQDVPGNAR